LLFLALSESSGFGILLARIVRYGTECTTRRFDLESP
jgi:hypothetical protein